MCLTVAVLSGLNPFVVVAVVLAWKLWASSKFLPRECRFNSEVRNRRCSVCAQPAQSKREQDMPTAAVREER